MSYELVTTLKAKAGNFGGSRSASAIKYIVVHYTANDGDTAKANANYFHNNVVTASAHYFVDDSYVYQSVPDLTIAYAVGGSKLSGNGGSLYKVATNTNSVSVELCDTKKDGKSAFTEETMANAATLIKKLMKTYNVDVDHVIRHYDVTGKICPKPFVESTSAWKAFKARLTTTTTTTEEYSYTRKQLIKDIQKIVGVAETGIADEALLNKTVTISATTNKSHAMVLPIKKRFKALGYDIDITTKTAGSKFTAATKKFQKNKVGLAEDSCDGIITKKKKTWKQLLGLN